EVGMTVGDLDPRLMVLPADAEVQRQVVGGPPVVLNVGPKHRGAMSPGAGADSPSEVGRKAEHKVGFANQETLRNRVHGVGRGESSSEVDVAGAAIVPGVESIHLLTDELAAGLHHVAAEDHRDVIDAVIDVGGEELLQAVIRVAQCRSVSKSL